MSTSADPPFAEIVQMVRARQIANTPLLEAMIEVRRRYNAEWVMPTARDVDGPTLPPLTPLLIAEAVDFHANQAAGSFPITRFPALEYKDTGKGSMDYAHRRRRACGAVMSKSKGKLVLRRAYRHLAGYATASLAVIPDFDMKMPRLVVRDPLTTYPEDKAPEDYTPPRNVAYVYAKSAEWIRANYPESRAEQGGPIAAKDRATETYTSWDLVEWVDENIISIGILGPHNWSNMWRSPYEAANARTYFMELRRWQNRAGFCTAYTMQRITLDKVATQISNITGHVDLLARLTALNILATEKSIWKDRFVLGKDGMLPRTADGEWHDGRTGKMNFVEGAHSIGELTSTPDPNNRATIDSLERNARISVGLVPQAGGETGGSSLRTGRGMDSMMNVAVNPRVREMQEIMEPALSHSNTAMLELWKGYWPSKKYTLFSGWGGDFTTFEFQPSVHVENTDNVVSYPLGGADEQGVTIILGQMQGTHAISRQTFREKHPWIDNPEMEGERVTAEQLEDALLASILQGASSGAMPPTYISELIEALRKEPNIAEAAKVANRKVQEEQARRAPAPGDDQHAAPEQMPGLALPGSTPVPSGPEAASPGAIAPSDDQTGLMHLMRTLKTTPPAQGPVPTQQVVA